MRSTEFLELFSRNPAVLTKRAPTEDEKKKHCLRTRRRPPHRPLRYRPDRCYRRVGMRCRRGHEGTDATIERAGAIMRSLSSDASTLSRALTVSQSRQAETGYALRTSGDRRENHRDHGHPPAPLASP